MGLEGKELEELYLRQYAGAVEENRLFYTKANETEFILTKHYIHKYLKPGAKVLDVGAGCGVYTKALSDEGLSFNNEKSRGIGYTFSDLDSWLYKLIDYEIAKMNMRYKEHSCNSEITPIE